MNNFFQLLAWIYLILIFISENIWNFFQDSLHNRHRLHCKVNVYYCTYVCAFFKSKRQKKSIWRSLTAHLLLYTPLLIPRMHCTYKIHKVEWWIFLKEARVDDNGFQSIDVIMNYLLKMAGACVCSTVRQNNNDG